MKQLFILFGVAVVLFGISAALSWYLGKSRVPPAETELAQGKSAKKKELQAEQEPRPESRSGEPLRTVERPPYTGGTDDAVQLAGQLRERLAAVREKEAKLVAQQKDLELVYQDIRGERSGLEELRKQLAGELRAVEDKMAAVERRFTESQQKLQEEAKTVRELQKNLLELKGVEQVNVKKMAEMYDTMDPERGARILEQLSNTGKMDTAVEVLAGMRERQAAKVLAALPPDSGLAAQFLERLKGFKRPSKTEPGTTPGP
jgi:flagellar motility protein MotE (MotC chaperone)